MGTSTPATFPSKMYRFADRTAEVPKKATAGAAFEAKKIMLGSMRTAVPSGRLRNAGKKGAKLNVVYKIAGTGASTVATVRAVPAGPWSWVERGTGAHLIGVGRATKRNPGLAYGYRKRRKFLKFPDGSVRIGPVAHPGTKGKYPWAKGLPLVRRAAPKQYVIWERKAMLEIFGA